jgi:ribonuclease Z
LNFSVQILGSNSALAAHGRFPTAQVVQHNNSFFLIDCGEGTQMRMSHFHVKRSKIQHIFISHLHGDHYFGLIGLLTSYHLMGRTAPLTIYGPPLLEEIIQLQLNASNSQLGYTLQFVPTTTDGKQLIYDSPELQVFTFPLKHRIDTTGFLFQEKVGKRKINKSSTALLGLQANDFLSLRDGKNVAVNGHTFENESLTFAPPVARSYAYCSDTCFLPELKEYIQGVDLLYHEATFMQEEALKASQTFHSTTLQAGEIAKLAEVKQLVIGHFSSKYADLEAPLKEAKSVFPNTILAIEGSVFQIERAAIQHLNYSH